MEEMYDHPEVTPDLSSENGPGVLFLYSSIPCHPVSGNLVRESPGRSVYIPKVVPSEIVEERGKLTRLVV